jgi:Ribose 5-phosphate isomerase RpiB
LKKIYIASDHAGFKLKESIKKKFSSKFEVLDLGTNYSKKSVNYPDYAHKLSKKIKKENVRHFSMWFGYGYGNDCK